MAVTGVIVAAVVAVSIATHGQHLALERCVIVFFLLLRLLDAVCDTSHRNSAYTGERRRCGTLEGVADTTGNRWCARGSRLRPPQLLLLLLLLGGGGLMCLPVRPLPEARRDNAAVPRGQREHRTHARREIDSPAASVAVGERRRKN
jgi:hypothetical protein